MLFIVVIDYDEMCFFFFFFPLFLSLQLACSGTMPCPSSTSSICCSSRSSRSPRARRCRVRPSPHQLRTRATTASASESWLLSQHRRAGLVNPNQPFSSQNQRTVAWGWNWHKVHFMTKKIDPNPTRSEMQRYDHNHKHFGLWNTEPTSLKFAK